MKTPFAAFTLAGVMMASPTLAAAAGETAAFGSRLDPFGLALLGAGLTGLALSRLLRRRH